MTSDRYGADVLSGDWRAHGRTRSREQSADPGLVVEDLETGWCGAVVRVEKAGGMHVVHLEDRHGKTRAFRLGPGFLVEGQPVVLTAPRAASAPARPSRTASGSVAVDTAARVAVGSRIFVEGRHDAELVEKVWGDDLRVEGVVVELLEGVDHLQDVIAAFSPGPGRRMGVLVDHLVTGSKEDRLVRSALAAYGGSDVLVVGHPFVDVWQSVRPDRLGWSSWPVIPRSIEWKKGVLAQLGWPNSSQADVATGWKKILGTVRSYSDLEPELLGRVEELIDFVTDPGDG
ncbi:Protein of unknown function (DUF3097) [Branchiibius hedensis]|uniref:DUF3097 domain-containing protein n=1 Tax=Branchiibius hedensis TaxID=672460 RepID=A0A2Y9C1I3_9MICO|nr:DUF3097 domain-containing protein [Branchiibius hedensis]PWJ25560.1 Protein of unknown function (DUF3097) [Branchiibius hedensis]SSA34373.1 Protein of unknown function [Branchiibius hedensis]